MVIIGFRRKAELIMEFFLNRGFEDRHGCVVKVSGIFLISGFDLFDLKIIEFSIDIV